MNTENDESNNSKLHKLGVSGFYGSNDYGYIHNRVVNCAKEIKTAQEIYSQGHYPHSNAKIIPHDHPLRIIMEQLSELDKQYAMYANTVPNKELFSTYEPPIIDTKRWDKK